MIPPWSTSPDAVRQVIAAARKRGSTPWCDHSVSAPAAFFEPDGVHLNARKARRFLRGR